MKKSLSTSEFYHHKLVFAGLCESREGSKAHLQLHLDYQWTLLLAYTWPAEPSIDIKYLSRISSVRGFALKSVLSHAYRMSFIRDFIVIFDLTEFNSALIALQIIAFN